MSTDKELARVIAHGRRFLERVRPPGTVLCCALTGSHLYGFSSPDSDIDLKGVALAPIEQLLGLGQPPEAFDRLEVFEGVECDLTLNEAGRALRLLQKGNGNMLERLTSPWQVVPSHDLDALAALARGSVSRASYRHYAGFFRGICREHEKSPRPTAKGLLYAWRVALTGIHLLRTGEVEASLPRLLEQHELELPRELIAHKEQNAEKGAVPPEMDARHRAWWPRLDELLRDARDSSPLPEEPSNRAECEAWLVERRLQGLGSGARAGIMET